jgi:multiple sugar transport system permease protein
MTDYRVDDSPQLREGQHPRPATTRPQRHRHHALARRISGLTAWILRGLLALYVLVPFYFLFLVSIQTRAESLSVPPDWFPSLNFSNYGAVLSRIFSDAPSTTAADFIWPGVRNSAIVATVVAAVNLVSGTTAGYAFARFRFPGRRAIPLAMLGSQMVPAFVLIIPYYVVLRNLGLTNSRWGVIVALLSITLPFTVWLMRAYFENIPIELDRAARIDGCTRTTAFLRVVLPLARPGLISIGLFAFMIAWNDFLFSVILVSDQEQILVQPAIAGLYNIREQSFGIMAAGSLLAALPTMTLALITQRYLVRGLLAGAKKG